MRADTAGILCGAGDRRYLEGTPLMQLSLAPTRPSDAPEDSAEPESAGRRRRPAVEAIACWSAKHRLVALAAWLVMVVGALLAGHAYGTARLPQYDPGPSGTAERMLSQLHVVSPPSESVLVQSRTPGAQRTFAADPQIRLAARDVVTALRALPATAADIRSPFGRLGRQLIGPHGGAVLITFNVAGPNANADSTVVSALRAVAAVQARYPDL